MRTKVLSYCAFVLLMYSACFPNPSKTPLNSDHIAFQALVDHFESEDRLNWQKPNEIIDLMGDLSDKVVADIGAGTGYFSFRLATKAKKVIAIEIDQRFLDFMDSLSVKLPQQVQNKFETRLGTMHHPNLKKDEIDVLLLVNVFYQMEDRVSYFKNLSTVLGEHATVFIVDYKKESPSTPTYGPPVEERTAQKTVLEEMKKAGFQLISKDDKMLPYQYLLQFSLANP